MALTSPKPSKIVSGQFCHGVGGAKGVCTCTSVWLCFLVIINVIVVILLLFFLLMWRRQRRGGCSCGWLAKAGGMAAWAPDVKQLPQQIIGGAMHVIFCPGAPLLLLLLFLLVWLWW